MNALKIQKNRFKDISASFSDLFVAAYCTDTEFPYVILSIYDYNGTAGVPEVSAVPIEVAKDASFMLNRFGLDKNFENLLRKEVIR